MMTFLMTAETPLMNVEECPPLKCGGHCSPRYIFMPLGIAGYRSDCDCVGLEIPLDMDALACKRSNGLWLSCECIDLVASHESIAAPALDALLDALSVSLSRHHMLLAAHGI